MAAGAGHLTGGMYVANPATGALTAQINDVSDFLSNRNKSSKPGAEVKMLDDKTNVKWIQNLALAFAIIMVILWNPIEGVIP